MPQAEPAELLIDIGVQTYKLRLLVYHVKIINNLPIFVKSGLVGNMVLRVEDGEGEVEPP